MACGQSQDLSCWPVQRTEIRAHTGKKKKKNKPNKTNKTYQKEIKKKYRKGVKSLRKYSRPWLLFEAAFDGVQMEGIIY